MPTSGYPSEPCPPLARHASDGTSRPGTRDDADGGQIAPMQVLAAGAGQQPVRALGGMLPTVLLPPHRALRRLAAEALEPAALRTRPGTSVPAPTHHPVDDED